MPYCLFEFCIGVMGGGGGEVAWVFMDGGPIEIGMDLVKLAT